MSRSALYLVACLVVPCLIVGCGDDGSPSGSGVPPSVTQVYPQDGATDVNLNTPIYVSFSKDMNEASLDGITLLLTPAYHIVYDSEANRAIVQLDSLLAANTTYQIRVASDVMDKHGNRLAENSTFSFTTGTFDCEHLTDVFEPNDDAASAVHVEFNTVYPLLSSCGAGERFDFFKFTLPLEAYVTIHTDCVFADTARMSWNMNFERADGGLYAGIGTSIGTENRKRSQRRSFLPGTYYVRLWKYHDDHHLVVYNLEIVTSEPCPNDAFEPNDFLDEATPIQPGETRGLRACYSDADFFSLSLVTGQTLTVTATETVFQNRHRMLNIYAPDGTQVTGVVVWDNPVVGTWTATEDGTHYFQVYWTSDNSVYDLEIDVTGP